MKKSNILVLMLIAFIGTTAAQEPILDSWIVNTDGTTATYWQSNGAPTPSYTFNTSTDSANVKKLCYTNDYVYISSGGMTTDMGKFTNPGAPSDQGYTFQFHRNPTVGSGTEAVPSTFVVAVLINGIPIFGLGDGKSWDSGSQSNSPMGQEVWVGNAYYSEGETLDTAFAAHPQQDGAYHSHATPFRLYDDPSSSHSPIVGFANDGYPIYGPFGYSDSLDNSSSITRLLPSYQLRSMTQRHTLSDGSALSASEYGPDVSATHPLGEYTEDYEYVEGLGDLDEHNGRWCVTPEYPGGTYAYFVATDNSGDPAFPFYIGSTYYGTPIAANNTSSSSASIPSGTSCDGAVSVNSFGSMERLDVFPSPAQGSITIKNTSAKQLGKITITNELGQIVYSSHVMNDRITLDITNFENGIYFCNQETETGNRIVKFIVANE